MSDEKVFRTYTPEEVVSALKYIREKQVKEFKFESHIINPPIDEVVRKDIIPYSLICMTLGGAWTHFIVYDKNKDENIIGSTQEFFEDAEKVISKISTEAFEGWCPDWDESLISDVKPAK